jgi:XTP/dITP diphosphohydrolase
MLLYACSTNEGKLREFDLAARQSAVPELDVQPLPDQKRITPPEETGATFEENAALKAVYYSQFTDQIVFADDSGLQVDALGGEPGVFSARYAGPNATDEANNRLLLEKLRHKLNRHGRFVCVIAIARRGKLLKTVHGAVEGEILETPRGANGFGYDPLFFYPPLGRCFGELSAEAKFEVSHRGDALRGLFEWLRCNFGTHPA